MLDWIFSSNKGDKVQQKAQDKLSKDQMWIYDFIKQYLLSPIWKNPLLDLVEENCYIFQDTQENKFQYTKIFNQFVGLTALLLESIIEEIGITDRILEKCIIKGLHTKSDRKIFQQILICNDFLTFKKIMIGKNKQLELLAMKKIDKDQKHSQISEMELQKNQIEKAIALSIVLDQKSKKQEEKDLQEAIRMSLQQEVVEQEKKIKKEEKIKQTKQRTSLGDLPPIVIGSSKPIRPIEILNEDKQELMKEIQVMKKKQEPVENEEERKKRLVEQREMIRKQKQLDRKEQLNLFVQNKAEAGKQKPSVSQQEIEKRKKLMKRLKQQLKE